MRSESSRRKRLLGALLIVVGAAALLVYLAGHLVTPLVSDHLSPKAEASWSGEQMYVYPTHRTQCHLEGHDAAEFSIGAHRGPGAIRRNGGQFRHTQAVLQVRGRWVPAADAGGTLSCSRGVWIARGPAVLLPRYADLGAFVVFPSLILMLGGAALRRLTR